MKRGHDPVELVPGEEGGSAAAEVDGLDELAGKMVLLELGFFQ
jgi:hypothetical protein